MGTTRPVPAPGSKPAPVPRDGHRTATIMSDQEWEAIGQRLGIPERQVQIIQAFIAGQGKPETIAQTLGIQPSSVKTHTERLYANLGVHDRVGVVVKVFLELLEMRGDSGQHWAARSAFQPVNNPKGAEHSSGQRRSGACC